MNRRIILAVLLLAFCQAVGAQLESQLASRRYTTQDGLPQMQVERVWQDSRGYIYIGTLSGFVRYDGRTFTPFLSGRRENIVSFVETGWGEVRAMNFRRQWTVGYDNLTLAQIDPEAHWLLNNLNSAQLPPDYVVLEDEQEQHRRLCHISRQGFLTVVADTLLDLMPPDRRLLLDADGLYIPTPQGLYLMAADITDSKADGKADGTPTLLAARRVADKSDVYCLHRTDTALLAFAADGVYRIGRQGLKLLLSYDWQQAHFGLAVSAQPDGTLILADEHTLYRYDGRHVLPLATGFNLVKDVLTDCWGRLWVATYQGLYCYYNCSFVNHRLTDPGDIVRAVAVAPNTHHQTPTTHLVMGTLNGKVLCDGTLIDDDPEQFYGFSAVTIGNCVYMPANGGVAVVEGSEVEGHAGKPRLLPLPPDRYRFIAADGARLLCGTMTQMLSYDPAAERLDTLADGLRHPWCAARDSEGRLWIGASMGLYCTEGDSTRLISYPQKLVITTMTGGGDRIVFASADSLFLIRHGEITTLNSQLPQLAGHEVRAVHLSPRGYLVVAAIDGLFVARADSLCRLSDAQFYNHLNGFTLIEPLKSVMAEAPDGTIYLPGIEEMTSFRPADLLTLSLKDTYVRRPLRWYEHWWVWVMGVGCLMMGVGALVRWIERQRSRLKMQRLQRVRLEREHLIQTIREEAVKAEQTKLAQDIVKMTERPKPVPLQLNTTNGMAMVDPSTVVYLKAERNYTRLMTFNSSIIVQQGIGTLTARLDENTFVRADRSTVVNIGYIYQLVPAERRCLFRAPDGTETETTLLAPAFKRLDKLLQNSGEQE